MTVNIIVFVVGLLCGILGTALVARNNKAKAQDALNKL